MIKERDFRVIFILKNRSHPYTNDLQFIFVHNIEVAMFYNDFPFGDFSFSSSITIGWRWTRSSQPTLFKIT